MTQDQPGISKARHWTLIVVLAAEAIAVAIGALAPWFDNEPPVAFRAAWLVQLLAAAAAATWGPCLKELNRRTLLAILAAPHLVLLLWPQNYTTLEFGAMNPHWHAVALVASLAVMAVLAFAAVLQRRSGIAGNLATLTATGAFLALLAAGAFFVVALPAGIDRPWGRPHTILQALATLAGVSLWSALALLHIPLARSDRSHAPLLLAMLQFLLAIAIFNVFSLNQALGDKDFWLERSHERVIFLSEPLASFWLHLGTHWGWHSDWILAPLAPLVLLTSAWLIERHGIRQLAQNARGPARAVASIGLMASALHLMFVRDVHETSMLGIPLMVLSLGAQIRYLHARHRAFLYLALAAFVMALACLVHMVYWAVSPGLIAIVLAKPVLNREAPWRPARALAELALVGIIIFTLYQVVFGCFQMADFAIEPGNYWGGGDALRWKPLARGAWVGDHSQGREAIYFVEYPPDAPTTLLLSRETLEEWGNIMVAAAPMLLFLGMLLPWFVLRSVGEPAAATVQFPLLSAGIGFAMFVWLFRFDLGFPRDWDLMMTLSLGVNLWAVANAASLARRAPRLMLACAILSAVYAWLTISPFLKF